MRERVARAFGARELRADYADAGDFLRVICVGLVGWFHIWQQSWLNPNLELGSFTLKLYPLVSCGYMFVDLMLMLSGFLLMLGWLSGRGRDARTFYAARAARILPSYLLCVLGLFFFVALPQGQYGTPRHLWTDLLGHLSFTHNLFPESYAQTRLNGALWTLAVEVQFYIVFPYLARAFARKPLRCYVAMVALGMFSRLQIYMNYADTSIYFNRLSAMLDVYANGMMAAMIYARLAKLEARAWRAWLSTFIALAALAGVYLILNRQMYRSGGENVRQGQMIWRYPLSLAGAAFAVCGSRSIGLLRALFSNRVTHLLSAVSFNFYIWHQYVAVQLKKWRVPPYSSEAPNRAGEAPWQNHYTLLCFGAALAAAILLTYCVEKPCARRIKRRAAARRPLETKPGA